MPRLPPVEKLPQTRLRARFCPGVGYSVLTRPQSQSSSSATSCARPVSVPWPISLRAMRITTLSSGCTTTQAFTSGAAPCAAAPVGKPSTSEPDAAPASVAAEVPRNCLRVTSRVWLTEEPSCCALRNSPFGRPVGLMPGSARCG